MHTNIKCVPRRRGTDEPVVWIGKGGCSLSVHEGLDVEAEGGADAHDIFAIELLEDSRLSRII